MTKLNELHSKLHADLFYSKDEIAWGKLSADGLSTITSLLRSLLLPLSGMSMMPEILKTIVKNEGPREADDDPGEGELKHSEIQRVVETHHARLVDAAKLVQLALSRFLLALELIMPKHLDKQRKTRGEAQARDAEARAQALSAHQANFASRFEVKLHRYYSSRKQLPEALAPLEAFSASEKAGEHRFAADPDVRQEFFVILYMNHLQDDLLNAALRLVQFADEKVADGTMKRGRLIVIKLIMTFSINHTNLTSPPSQKPKSSRNSHADNHKRHKSPNNTKKPRQPRRILPWNLDIHPKNSRNKMTRHKNSRQTRNLTHNRINSITNPQVRRTKLRQGIRLRPANNLIKMRQRRHSRNQMVLHIAQIKQQVTIWKDGWFVWRLTPFHESVQHVHFAV
jgi:hypothetical protein